MRHSSIKMDTPIEIIKIVPYNPLISKCEIKVCYVGDDENRNTSVITKSVARDHLAPSLPGSPIVGFYNVETEDFEDHNRYLTIEDGKLKMSTNTRPYGFVDLNAKVWFQKFMDDGIEHEYLMTEGWLWTGQFPECQRIIDKGNGQSMELDEKNTHGYRTKSINSSKQIFIINEAIISKLCILGEDVEPCFEGATITAPTIQFSLGEDFKQQLFSMMNELKQLLNDEGGAKVFTKYAVEIGDTLWNALYNLVSSNYAENKIVGVYEEDEQKFAVLQNENKYCRLNFSIAENGEYEFASELVDVESYTPDEEPQFSEEAVKNFVENLGKEEQTEGQKTEDQVEGVKLDKTGEENCPNCGNPMSACTCSVATYNLEEIPEYIELQSKYSALEATHNALVVSYEELKSAKDSIESQLAPLKVFKAKVEKKEKENLIASFYMLTDEDKKDVIENIDTYTLEDIEAKLSIICVRNRVSFNHNDKQEESQTNPVTYSLNGEAEDSYLPAWVKVAIKVAEKMN